LGKDGEEEEVLIHWVPVRDVISYKWQIWAKYSQCIFICLGLIGLSKERVTCVYMYFPTHWETCSRFTNTMKGK
jgi:hypothetical protein